MSHRQLKKIELNHLLCSRPVSVCRAQSLHSLGEVFSWSVSQLRKPSMPWVGCRYHRSLPCSTSGSVRFSGVPKGQA